MSRPVHLRRQLALAAALAATSWGATAVPAAAADAHAAQPAKGAKPATGEPHRHAQGQRQDSTAARGPKAHGDPAGNNGTVKVAPLGDLDSIPNNTSHPGCTFQLEWYGYDQGDDIVSQVTFAMQAPTGDVSLAVDGPGSVFVGADPASGAGTDSGLDGREAYTLSFAGEPHPQQGYHVRLTVATPHSNGNDTKSKMFWVEPCDTGTEMDTATATATPAPETPGVGGAGVGHESPSDTEVLGIQATAAPQPQGAGSGPAGAPVEAQVAGRSKAVPTAVDAGENHHTVFATVAGSPWPLALVGAGAILTAGALVARRRRAGAAGR